MKLSLTRYNTIVAKCYTFHRYETNPRWKGVWIDYTINNIWILLTISIINTSVVSLRYIQTLSTVVNTLLPQKYKKTNLWPKLIYYHQACFLVSSGPISLQTPFSFKKPRDSYSTEDLKNMAKELSTQTALYSLKSFVLLSEVKYIQVNNVLYFFKNKKWKSYFPWKLFMSNSINPWEAVGLSVPVIGKTE